MSQEPAIPGADFAQEAMDGQPEGQSTPGTTLPDWTTIEASYRAGVGSLRAIAGGHGVTEGAIRARAKKAGWVRLAGVAQCVEPRIAALEAQVAALQAVVREKDRLIEDLSRGADSGFPELAPVVVVCDR
jgi:hypothetical protein